jgi:hypothetical protein
MFGKLRSDVLATLHNRFDVLTDTRPPHFSGIDPAQAARTAPPLRHAGFFAAGAKDFARRVVILF